MNMTGTYIVEVVTFHNVSVVGKGPIDRIANDCNQFDC